MRQQWLKICCCHGRLFIVAWGMTLLWTNVDYILCFLAAASLPKGVPLMHTQRDSILRQRGGTRGQPARLPDSLHRRAAARRAEQQRAMQPLLATGLVKEAVFQCGIRMDYSSRFPFDEVAFTEDTLFQQLGRRRTEPHPEDKGGFLHRSCRG